MIKCGCGNEIHPERYELHFGHKTAGSIVITSKKAFDNYSKVSYRKGKASNMAYASRLSTSF